MTGFRVRHSICIGFRDRVRHGVCIGFRIWGLGIGVMDRVQG